MHMIINQLIIQWTLNKHFTWHLLILCSCMSFCCLTRMHEFFFYKGLPFLWVNQRVDISSSSILAFQNFLVTLYLARSFLVTMPTTWNKIVKFHTIKKVYLCSWNCNFNTLYKVFNIFLLKLITYNYIGVKIILSITKVFSASVLGEYL